MTTECRRHLTVQQVLYSKYMAPAEERLQLLENDSQAQEDPGKESGEESTTSDTESTCLSRKRLRMLKGCFVDLAASIVFWWAISSDVSDAVFYGFLAGIVGARDPRVRTCAAAAGARLTLHLRPPVRHLVQKKLGLPNLFFPLAMLETSGSLFNLIQWISNALTVIFDAILCI
ncbi:unnamed protein product [Cladocopium goreaui]|uniref:Uncharacterized protein n=1 Tax=Cladocopium goreaui TaxID=2562237 RepID=A0A9P1BR73_9DINO|nr:unnamed protein product [Cladocopium goreaui]